MERLAEMNVAAFGQRVLPEVERAIQEIAQVVNAAQTGYVIEQSEMEVKRIGEELTRRLLEQAAQARIDSSESSFSPSGGRRWASQTA